MPNKGQAQGISILPCTSQKKTKSRNGCQRCKLKRLKCGEEKPSCQNCVNRQVPCPGYKKSLKWSTKYEMFKPDDLDLTEEFVAFENVSIGGKPLTTNVEAPTSRTEEEQTYPSPESDSLSRDEASPGKKTNRRKSSVANPVDNKNKDQHDPVSVDDTSFMPETGVATGFPSPALDTTSIPELDSFSDLPSGTFDEHVFFTGDDLSGCVDDLLEFQPSFETEELPGRQHHLSRQAQARSLLHTFYRLRPSFPIAGLIDDSSYLVGYYFSNVCNIYSSFDSDLNPFRNAVKDVWTTTPSVYFAIQSMAAAQLANHSPDWETKGMELQKKAYSNLNHELELSKHNVAASGRTMLAILLLGLTTAWHKADDLGECHLQAARNLIIPKLLEVAPEMKEGTSYDVQFYEESLIYWEMLMGFVTPSNAPLTRPVNRPQPDFRGPDGKITPHPWTGVAPHVQMLFAEVGRLVRRERQDKFRNTSFDFDPLGDFCFTDALSDPNPYLSDLDLDPSPPISFSDTTTTLSLASDLEEHLLAAPIPAESDIADIHDPKTRKAHFIAVADAYRYAGLLQIYRVFPALLRTRLGTPSPAFDFDFAAPVHDTTAHDATAFLNALALHVLQLLGKIPLDSGTMCIQPIVLLAAAAELRTTSTNTLDFFSAEAAARDGEIRRARQFVQDKFQLFARKLPAKPMVVMSEAVREVWRRGDAGVRDVFWLDVMMERGWVTVMG